MSYPFIIWTMQRTGGTALTGLLMDMSEHQRAEHEPFNWSRKKPRQFWPVAGAWEKTGDDTALAESLDEIFSQRFLIKHCYELPSTAEFNQHLMAASTKMPYRHIHLLRRDETSRLISKYIAEAEGTWFKDYSNKVFADVASGKRKLKPLPVEAIVKHYNRCRERTEAITNALNKHGVEFKTMYYEDIYSNEHNKCRSRIFELLEFLEFTWEDIATHGARIKESIFNIGQNTCSVMKFVPNLQEVLSALAAAGCPVASDHSLDAILPEVARPKKPPSRISVSFQDPVETDGPRAPFLEVSPHSARPADVGRPMFETEL